MASLVVNCLGIVAFHVTASPNINNINGPIKDVRVIVKYLIANSCYFINCLKNKKSPVSFGSHVYVKRLLRLQFRPCYQSSNNSIMILTSLLLYTVAYHAHNLLI